MSFSKNVKQFREKKGMTQEELATRVKVAQPMIALYEKGERVPNIFNGVRLAKALGTTCEELVAE